MIPRRISGATHALGAPEGWDEARLGRCMTLHTRRLDAGGHEVWESAWEPTPEELAALNAGGSVILRIVGGQPAAMLYVEPAAAEEPGG